MYPEDLLFDPYADLDVHTRALPHWRQEGKLYIVTWRLADSIPTEKRDELQRERDVFIKAHGDPFTTLMSIELQRRYHQLFNERVQHWLDAGVGSCVLRDQRACSIMRDAFLHFHGVRYQLGSFAIAANHVHVLVAPVVGIDLSQVLHSWKSYTAKAINKALGRKGTLWQDESYDHLVRSEAALYRISTYIHAHKDQGAYVERRRLL
jgi:REP element-mobilizing transposase RayT